MVYYHIVDGEETWGCRNGVLLKDAENAIDLNMSNRMVLDKMETKCALVRSIKERVQNFRDYNEE